MKKTLLLLIITILVTAVTYIVISSVLTPQGWQAKLVSPNFVGFTKEQPETLTPEPSSNMKAPTTFQFDGNTDLNLELEKVNPEINSI